MLLNSPSLLRLVVVSSSQLHSSNVGLQLLFPWSSSSTVSNNTCVYSFRLRWSSSSDGKSFKSSSTLNQLSFVLLRTNDRKFVIGHGGGSINGVSKRFKLRLTNSIRGICDKIPKTCWRFCLLLAAAQTHTTDGELGHCHLANENKFLETKFTSFQFSNLFCAKSSSLTVLHFFFRSSASPAWSMPQSLSTSTCGTLCVKNDHQNCVIKLWKQKVSESKIKCC